MNQDELYRNYITDALKYIVNNTAEQESRTLLNTSFRELLHPVTKKDIEENEEKANDIIAKMRSKLGG